MRFAPLFAANAHVARLRYPRPSSGRPFTGSIFSAWPPARGWRKESQNDAQWMEMWAAQPEGGSMGPGSTTCDSAQAWIDALQYLIVKYVRGGGQPDTAPNFVSHAYVAADCRIVAALGGRISHGDSIFTAPTDEEMAGRENLEWEGWVDPQTETVYIWIFPDGNQMTATKQSDGSYLITIDGPVEDTTQSTPFDEGSAPDEEEIPGDDIWLQLLSRIGAARTESSDDDTDTNLDVRLDAPPPFMPGRPTPEP